MVQEISDKEIMQQNDLKALEQQARFNQQALYRLRTWVETATPEAWKTELSREYEAVTVKLLDTEESEQKEKLSARLGEITESLESLEDPELAIETFGRQVEKVQKNLKQRQHRSFLLIQHRNRLAEQQIEKQQKVLEEDRERVSRRLWGEDLDRQRRQILELLDRLRLDAKTAQGRLTSDETFYRSALRGLLRNVEMALEVMRRVPRFRDDDADYSVSSIPD